MRAWLFTGRTRVCYKVPNPTFPISPKVVAQSRAEFARPFFEILNRAQEENFHVKDHHWLMRFRHVGYYTVC